MMSGEAIRILTQAVDLAADSEKGIIELEGLVKRFTTQVGSLLLRCRF